MASAFRIVQCLLAATVLLATSASAGPVWRDNFNAGPQLPWMNLRGDWLAAGGQYAAQSPENEPVTAALLPYELGDFSFEVDLVQPTDGGVWVRANADATEGVMLVVFPDRMYWHVITDPSSGPWTSYGFASIAPALDDGAHRIRVTGKGPILRAYVNDASVATSTLDLTTVTNPPGTDFLRGRVGLYDNAAPGTRFDNVRLEAGSPVEVIAVGDVGNSSVWFYPVDASGDVAPIAWLSGANTGLSDVRSVAFDSDHLYVASGGGQSIRAFAMSALGNSVPLRTITGATTTLGGVHGIELQGGELFASSTTGPVCVFDAMADGDVAPLRSIGSVTGAYAIEQDGAEIFVAPHFANPANIYAFNRDADGSTLPLRHLAGASTGLDCCNLGLAATNTELFVGQYSAGRILVFDRNADGDTAPLRILAGASTGLSALVDIAVRGGELFVANSGVPRVLVFPENGTGDIAPIRFIGGPSTGIHTPFSLAFGVYMNPETIFENGFE